MLAKMTQQEWIAEGRRRFGDDQLKWKFICPTCKHVAAVEDWHKAGAPDGAVAFSCVGCWLPGTTREAFASKGKGPCNYAGGGFFMLNPISVDDHLLFDFAPEGGQ